MRIEVLCLFDELLGDLVCVARLLSPVAHHVVCYVILVEMEPVEIALAEEGPAFQIDDDALFD